MIRRLALMRRFSGAAWRSKASLMDMPAMSPTMTEGGIVKWAFKPGDSFNTGDVLLDIETDKAQISVEAQDDGILAEVLEQDGATGVPVGKPIAVLCEPDDDPKAVDVASLLEGHKKSVSKPAPEPEQAKSPEPEPAPKSSGDAPSPQAIALPSVQRLASENGVDVSKIKGTGPSGRVLKGDVLAFLKKIPAKYPQELRDKLAKCEKLDLSKIERAEPKKAAPEPPKRVDRTLELSTEVLLDEGFDVAQILGKIDRLAIRDAIRSTKPRPSVLRDPVLDLLCAPTKKVPFEHSATVVVERAQPVSVNVEVSYKPTDAVAEQMADVYLEAVEYYMTSGTDELV